MGAPACSDLTLICNWIAISIINSLEWPGLDPSKSPDYAKELLGTMGVLLTFSSISLHGHTFVMEKQRLSEFAQSKKEMTNCGNQPFCAWNLSLPYGGGAFWRCCGGDSNSPKGGARDPEHEESGHRAILSVLLQSPQKTPSWIALLDARPGLLPNPRLGGSGGLQRESLHCCMKDLFTGINSCLIKELASSGMITKITSATKDWNAGDLLSERVLAPWIFDGTGIKCDLLSGLLKQQTEIRRIHDRPKSKSI